MPVPSFGEIFWKEVWILEKLCYNTVVWRRRDNYMYLKRKIYDRLLEWKSRSGHSTLEANEARQVEKTLFSGDKIQ